MKIHLFSRVLAAPFVIIAFISFYYGFDGNKDFFTYGLIPSVILLATIYVFHNQIDFWYQQRFPIRFDKEELALAKKFSPFYNSLSEEQKLRFEQRMHTYISSKEFTAMGSEAESVPHDLQILTGLIVIEMTFFKEKDFRLDHFDHIVFYKHPFPSPRMKFLHTVETNAEDGVIITALDYFSSAINDPERFYHVGYHVFGEAFMYQFNKEPYPLELSWEPIENATGFKQKDIIKVLGLEKIDLLPVTISVFFSHNERLKEVDPTLWSTFNDIFRTRNI